MARELFSASDVIAFKEIDTGGNSAGNGGDGYSFGKISNEPSIKFEAYNKAEGADVDVKTGDHVDQEAYWDASANGGRASARDADKVWAKANGGTAKSNGDQESESGHNKSEVDANTTAKQSNEIKADMSQFVSAGNGGDGGDENIAMGGDVEFALVHTNPNTEIVEMDNVLNESGYFDIDDFVQM